jgi:hypothetical protein
MSRLKAVTHKAIDTETEIVKTETSDMEIIEMSILEGAIPC